MSITKLKPAGSWAPPKTTHTAHRTLSGRVIFGLLTGDEEPDPTSDVVTSAKDRR
jgi:hypothetical protein